MSCIFKAPEMEDIAHIFLNSSSMRKINILDYTLDKWLIGIHTLKQYISCMFRTEIYRNASFYLNKTVSLRIAYKDLIGLQQKLFAFPFNSTVCSLLLYIILLFYILHSDMALCLIIKDHYFKAKHFFSFGSLSNE